MIRIVSEPEIITPNENAPSIKPKRSPAPRLRIDHFFIWIAVTFMRVKLLARGELQFNVPTVLNIFYHFLTTIPITISCLGIYWLIKRQKFLNEVGHWIAIVFVGKLIPHLILTFLIDSGCFRNRTVRADLILRDSLDICLIILFFGIAKWIADTFTWKLYCWAIILNSLFFIFPTTTFFFPSLYTDESISNIFLTYEYIGIAMDAILFILIFIAAFLDWKKSRTRHWSHWAVVGSQSGVQVMLVIFGIQSYLIMWHSQF